MNIEEYITDVSVSIKQAMKQLDKGGIGFLCVYRDNHVYGIITDGDIRRAILNNIGLEQPVEIIANKKFISVAPGYTEKEIHDVFNKHTHIEHIPVLEKGELVAIVTEDDLIEHKKRPKKKIEADVVIMAGGRGSRLQPVTNIIPKPLLPLGEKSVIETIMEEYVHYGIANFYISVNYKASMIKAYFQEISPTYSINYIEESKPLGTAGALCYLKNKRISDTFFVSNCDILIKDDYAEIFDFHVKGDFDITLIASMQHHTVPYGICEIKDGGELTAINEKPEYNLLVNTGMYILNNKVIELIPEGKFYHITHLINDVLKNKGNVGVYPVSENAWIDVGQWHSYSQTLQ